MRGKEIVYFIMLVVIIGAGIFGTTTLKNWYVGYKTSQQQGRTLQSTSGIIEDGSESDKQRDKTDTGLAEAREDFKRQYEEDKRRDPEIASRAVRVVPQRVRDNFRARRLARERLGCAGSECRKGLEEDSASER